MDIRSTGIRDDFDRPLENPARFPWVQAGDWPMKLGDASGPPYSGGMTGTKGTPPDSNRDVWSIERYSGNVECWAYNTGGAGLQCGNRIGLYASISPLVGYELLPHDYVGGFYWTLRRYDADGTLTELDPGLTNPGGGWTLIRTFGPYVETWGAGSDPTNWTMYQQVVDTTYRTGLYLGLGTTCAESGWDNFGGGLVNRQYIYRWLAT